MTTRPTRGDTDEAGGRPVRRDTRFLPLLAGPAGTAAIRRVLSVAVLITIDLTACFAGVYAALAMKLVLQGESVDSSAIWAVEQKALPIAATTMILVFAKNRLYAPREQRGGAARLLSSVTLATLIVLIVVLVAGWRFDTYYIFYSSWILVGVLVVALRSSYDSVTALVLDAHALRAAGAAGGVADPGGEHRGEPPALREPPGRALPGRRPPAADPGGERRGGRGRGRGAAGRRWTRTRWTR